MVWRRQIADTETPVAAALKLIEPERGDFLLESVEGGATRGRHSLIGLAPDLVFRAHGTRAEINRHWLADRAAFLPCETAPLQALRDLVIACRMDVPAELPPALACLVGYFGYETVGLVEQLDRPTHDPLGLPDMMFVRPTVVLIFDRLADALFLVAPVWPDPARAPAVIVEEAQDRINTVAARLASGALPPPVRDSKPAEISLTPVLPEGRYAAMIARAKEYIVAGDIFQVVLAQRFTAPFTLPAFELYRALRRINPSPFLYHLDLPGFAMYRIEPRDTGAGTRRRGDDPPDRRYAAPRQDSGRGRSQPALSLLADPKERAEHLTCCSISAATMSAASPRPGSVQGHRRATPQNSTTAMSCTSCRTSSAWLAPGNAVALDALFAGFPAGTVSGAPKVRALRGDRRSSKAKCAAPMPAASAIFRPTARWIHASCAAHRGGRRTA